MLQATPRDRPVTLNVPDRPDREAVETVNDGLTPDTVSVISLAFAVLAAVWFSDGARGGLVAGALLLCASLVLGAFRPDGILDRAGEFAMYAGLVAGASGSVPGVSAVPGVDLWWAATGAMALLSVRDMIGASYAATRPAQREGSGRGVRRWAVHNLGLPSGVRYALIAATAAFAGARLTFTVLLAWGSAAAVAVLAGRVTRSLAR
ncbi:DUF5941 domain-containing protein [Spirillospora sp. NBC_00431]